MAAPLRISLKGQPSELLGWPLFMEEIQFLVPAAATAAYPTTAAGRAVADG